MFQGFFSRPIVQGGKKELVMNPLYIDDPEATGDTQVESNLMEKEHFTRGESIDTTEESKPPVFCISSGKLDKIDIKNTTWTESSTDVGEHRQDSMIPTISKRWPSLNNNLDKATDPSEHSFELPTSNECAIPFFSDSDNTALSTDDLVNQEYNYGVLPSPEQTYRIKQTVLTTVQPSNGFQFFRPTSNSNAKNESQFKSWTNKHNKVSI